MKKNIYLMILMTTLASTLPFLVAPVILGFEHHSGGEGGVWPGRWWRGRDLSLH